MQDEELMSTSLMADPKSPWRKLTDFFTGGSPSARMSSGLAGGVGMTVPYKGLAHQAVIGDLLDAIRGIAAKRPSTWESLSKLPQKEQMRFLKARHALSQDRIPAERDLLRRMDD